MVNATISRNGTSVTLPLVEGSGEAVVARDAGSQTISKQDTNTRAPVFSDQFSGADALTVRGILSGASAYADAKKLAEDIVAPRLPQSGTSLTLDLSNLPGLSSYEVAPATESALTLAYKPGESELVGVDFSAAVVDSSVGGSETDITTATPDSGDGITVATPDGSTSVTLTDDLMVKREVGRPDGEIQPTQKELPRYIDKDNPASDVFEISGRFTETVGGQTPAQQAQTLQKDILRPIRGYDPLTLSFNGSLFGLDKYDVFPPGAASGRVTYLTGRTGDIGVPQLRLAVAFPNDEL